MHADKDAMNQSLFARSASISLEQQSWQSMILADQFVLHAKGHKQSVRLPGPRLVAVQQIEHLQQLMGA